MGQDTQRHTHRRANTKKKPSTLRDLAHEATSGPGVDDGALPLESSGYDTAGNGTLLSIIRKNHKKKGRR